jgi:pSer/pThr/pTyr-binding forkhead associated (FHA) protein
MLTPAACLEVVVGTAVGTSILVEDDMVIGRHVEGPGRLGDDEEISRMHARVTVDADGVCTIEDLGSTNGTFVNGLRISAPQALSVGDMIELGQTTLAVRVLPTAEEPATAEAQAAPSPGPSAHPPTADAPAQANVPAHAAELEQDVLASLAAVGEPDPPPGAAAAAATLNLRLEVDFVGREAWLHLTETSEPIRLVFEDGAWRQHPPMPGEKGGPA